MATSNFAPVKFGLPLIVGGISDDEIENDFEFEDTQLMLDQFNTTLDHFEVYLLGGYYCGYQFMVKERKDYIDYEDIDTLTDDEADYFYGETANEVRKQFHEEMGKIKDYFEALARTGYTELGVVGTFSNGETVYREAKHDL